MAKTSGIGHHFLIDGYDLSGDIGAVDTLRGGRAALDVTGINVGSPERILGLRSGDMGFSAWWNIAAGQAHPVLDTFPTADRIGTYAAYTTTAGVVGDVACAMAGKQLDYAPARAADGSLMATYTLASNGFPLEWGNLLTNGVQTFSGAGNGTSWDRTTVTSSYGAAAYMQVTAFTGTSATVTITDSANNSTFAAIGSGLTFSAASAVGAQRITTTLTQTVRRYFRIEISGTFSSFSCLVVLVPYDLSQAT